MMRVKALALTVIILVLATSGAAADDKKAAPPDSARQQKTVEPTFQELLEFLGQWETEDGNWIDPTDTEWLLPPNQGPNNDKNKQK